MSKNNCCCCPRGTRPDPRPAVSFMPPIPEDEFLGFAPLGGSVTNTLGLAGIDSASFPMEPRSVVEDDDTVFAKSKPPVEFQLSPAFSGPGIPSADCIQAQTDLVFSKGRHHGVEGAGTWLDGTQWVTWDGIPYNPCIGTKEDLMAFVWPNGQWYMRGLREVFYSENPFADIWHPTIPEIERWNVRVIRHFRDLLGITQPISNSRNLFLRSQFSTERYRTRYWDTLYPSGNCEGTTNAHCGSTFIPDPEHQTPYLAQYPIGQQTPAFPQSGAEGLFLVEKDWPWSIKFARLIWGQVNGEWMSGHAGPFYSRQYIGYNFWCNPSTGNSNVRVKWSGSAPNPCS